MLRLQVAVLFTVALAFSAVKCTDSNEAPNVENLDDSIPASSSNQEFFRYFIKEPLTKDVSPKLLIKHNLGGRVNGDRLLIRYKSPRKDSGTPFDVKQLESFEFEATITYIEYVVDQSTNESKITLTSGGTGQKNAALEVEGGKTLYFSYTTEIYGYY
ncbi:uncharacterized protein LOC129570563 [Sitodiplosis mosellana]|uniref:uncharacterized protein LOC129570563 n=1 Tax=Sitodiplosis mosellana TaxID=263140 RepID=UPI002443B39D|nr:uncharacterized protein LOC129570563 [Sitodiplosis mosellana]